MNICAATLKLLQGQLYFYPQLSTKNGGKVTEWDTKTKARARLLRERERERDEPDEIGTGVEKMRRERGTLKTLGMPRGSKGNQICL